MVVIRNICISLAGIAIGGALAVYVLERLRKKRQSLKPTEIILVTNHEEWKVAWEKLSQDLKTFPVLGFDCEWVSEGCHRNPVSLVQFSSLSGLCVLVRTRLLLKTDGSLPDTFKDVLFDKRILKVGVASVEDGEMLLKDFNLRCFGFVDLRNFVQRCVKLKFRPGGLKKLAKDVLNVDLDKNFKIRCGNWEADELSEGQISYAALDSLISIKIFLKLLHLNFSIKIKQSLAGINGDCGDQVVLNTCRGIVDLKYNNIKEFKNKGKQSSNKTNNTFKDVITSRAYEIRKSPLYHGSKLYNQDNELLCTCDVKKARWYLEKNLAEKISDDPLCVRLLFEPAGKPSSQTDYYLQEKNNVCVVCGKPDSYMRKFVIPHEYKRHLPAISKEHKSHDVVLMCVSCHLLSDRLDVPMKAVLAEKYKARIRCDKYLSQSKEIAKVKSAALALSKDKYSKKIPKSRFDELENILKEHFNVDEVNDEIIQKSLELAKERQENKDYEEHGYKVMQEVLTEGSLMEFETMWRQHLLDSMNPMFMPLQWSVNHGHEKLKTDDGINRLINGS